MSIEVKNIVKNFGTFRALDDVSLRVNSGELVALLGPSGSGKTTLLRIIAGLQTPNAGQVLFDDTDTTARAVRERQVGFVFQHYALFRHMNVFENVAFGLRVRPRRERPAKDEIHERVTKLLKLVQVEWLANQYPDQLSGGQRQRVALARALVVEPKVLLLDEPFGALDAKVRRELRRWLRRLHDEIHVTSVFVTHDQEEALEVADRVVIMDKGKIIQVGAPDEVYEHPATPFVFEFLGNVNLFRSRIDSGFATVAGARFMAPEHTELTGATGRAYVRPQDFEIVPGLVGGVGAISAEVIHVAPVGALVRLDMRSLAQGEEPGEEFEVELTREQFKELGVGKGDRVWLRPRRLAVFADSLTCSEL